MIRVLNQGRDSGKNILALWAQRSGDVKRHALALHNQRSPHGRTDCYRPHRMRFAATQASGPDWPLFAPPASVRRTPRAKTRGCAPGPPAVKHKRAPYTSHLAFATHYSSPEYPGPCALDYQRPQAHLRRAVPQRLPTLPSPDWCTSLYPSFHHRCELFVPLREQRAQRDALLPRLPLRCTRARLARKERNAAIAVHAWALSHRATREAATRSPALEAIRVAVPKAARTHGAYSCVSVSTPQHAIA